MSCVVGVVGGSGGVGASSFAAVLATAAGASVLVDLDVLGGGVDVRLGIEACPGARWSGLRVAGGHLNPDTLIAGLPRWGRVAVLAADVHALDPGAVGQVVDVASAAGSVVLDLPRTPGAARAAGIDRCDLVVLLARADVDGVAAAHAVANGLAGVAAGLVARRGELAADQAARLVGVPLLGQLPVLRAPRAVLRPGRLPRAEMHLAAGVLGGVSSDDMPVAAPRRPPTAGAAA